MQKRKPISLCNGNPFTKTVLTALASRYENVIAEWKSKYARKNVPVPGENDARLSVWWPNSGVEFLLFSIAWVITNSILRSAQAKDRKDPTNGVS